MIKLVKVFAVLGLSSLVAGTVLASTSAEDKIRERTKPVSQVCVEGDACASAATEAPAASASARSGEEIYGAVCMACHSTGAAGAPKIGDNAAWAPRIDQGLEIVFQNALNGFNAMPPKGTCSDCSDDEIKATVDYMVSKSQ